MVVTCFKCKVYISKSFDSYLKCVSESCDNTAHIECTSISYKYKERHKKTFKCGQDSCNNLTSQASMDNPPADGSADGAMNQIPLVTHQMI